MRSGARKRAARYGTLPVVSITTRVNWSSVVNLIRSMETSDAGGALAATTRQLVSARKVLLYIVVIRTVAVRSIHPPKSRFRPDGGKQKRLTC